MRYSNVRPFILPAFCNIVGVACLSLGSHGWGWGLIVTAVALLICQ